MIPGLTERLTAASISAAERGLVPDALIRAGMRRLCRARLAEAVDPEGSPVERFLDEVSTGPIARHVEDANAQHYELPAQFFERVLGPHLKYSSCCFEPGVDDLGTAERAALRATSERADLQDGQDILELGCGWGSMTLWMAAQFPNARITAVSNSSSQRAFIRLQLRERGFDNVRVITADINEFEPDGTFDRVVSVEMFEHMHNVSALLDRISIWLRPGGALFVHVFCHRSTPYRFETEGASNWMGRYFFTGGCMPSLDLYPRLTGALQVTQRWEWDGLHYARTAEAWLANLDRNRDELMPILTRVYGEREARRWFHRWRLFFLACAELFGFAEGTEWLVGHYRFEHADSVCAAMTA